MKNWYVQKSHFYSLNSNLHALNIANRKTFLYAPNIRNPFEWLISSIYSGHTKYIEHEKETCIEHNIGLWRPFQDTEAKRERGIAVMQCLQTYIDLASPAGKYNCFDEHISTVFMYNMNMMNGHKSGVIRPQAISWANAAGDLCCCMASLGHNELRYYPNILLCLKGIAIFLWKKIFKKTKLVFHTAINHVQMTQIYHYNAMTITEKAINFLRSTSVLKLNKCLSLADHWVLSKCKSVNQYVYTGWQLFIHGSN